MISAPRAVTLKRVAAFAVLLGICVSLFVGLTSLRAPSASAATPVTFSYTGGTQTYTVPSGVSAIVISASGASGSIGGGTPGKGATVSARFEVAEGTVLTVVVGQQGAPTYQAASGSFNGGGAGFQGGGASDVRSGGATLNDRFLVAGGGGGGDTGAGGDGGLVGIDGGSASPTTGAGGGTASSGGAGGVSNTGSGTAGTLGVGGDHFGFGAGGGGGGYYGGGGGACLPCSGGGGGSSFVAPSGTDASFTTGAHTGNGEVVITAEDPTPPPPPPPTPTPTAASPSPTTTGTTTPRPTSDPTSSRTPAVVPFVPAAPDTDSDEDPGATPPDDSAPDAAPDAPGDTPNGDGSNPNSADPDSDLPPYDPLAHADDLVTDTGVAAFALLGATAGGIAAASKRKNAKVVGGSTSFDQNANEDLAWGDKSGTWRWPGVALLDKISTVAPVAVAPFSPLAARVMVDAAYLRAVAGTMWLVAPVLGIAGGAAAVAINQGSPLPPPLWIVLAVLAIGIIDAFAGFLGMLVFVLGTVLLGGIVDGDSVRILLGVATLWFVLPLIARSMRPLDRVWSADRGEQFDRVGDLAIASLIAGWTASKIVGAWPGLSGLELPIVTSTALIALVATLALVVRMFIEGAAATHYPLRVAAVTPDEIPDPSAWQQVGSILLRTAVFVFVAIVFIGTCWQLWAGAALFAIPLLLKVIDSRLPNSEWLYRVRPKSFVGLVVMMIIGLIATSLFTSVVDDPVDVLTWGFFVLSVPGFLFTMMQVFGRDGPDPGISWKRRAIGTAIFVIGVALVVFG